MFSSAHSVAMKYALMVLSTQKTSKCMNRSCWLKDPVTTAAVCSTGHIAWDYAVFVDHRGSHR